MPKQKMTGIMVNGSVRSAGVTFYTRKGQTVVRTSRSMQPKRRTRAQFDQRMRMKHTIALWRMLRVCSPMFTSGKNAFTGFASLANRLPVVYLPNAGGLEHGSLLLPGMPVSEGALPTVGLRLGEVEGAAALLTDLKRGDLTHGDRLMLYTLRQVVEGNTPRVRIAVAEMPLSRFVIAGGCLALVGDEYADPMAGWALVRVSGDRCSTQTAVSSCTYYEQFATDEAMQAAAKSYGGLTGD